MLVKNSEFFSEDFLFVTRSILLERYGTRNRVQFQFVKCLKIVVKFRICHVTLFTLQLVPVRFAPE
jgi:hypothetical protein